MGNLQGVTFALSLGKLSAEAMLFGCNLTA